MGVIDLNATAVLRIMAIFWMLGAGINLAWVGHHSYILAKGLGTERLNIFRVILKAVSGAYCIYGATIYCLACAGIMDPAHLGSFYFRPTIPLYVSLLSADAIASWTNIKEARLKKQQKEIILEANSLIKEYTAMVQEWSNPEPEEA